jgi:hypothetical protein
MKVPVDCINVFQVLQACLTSPGVVGALEATVGIVGVYGLQSI